MIRRMNPGAIPEAVRIFVGCDPNDCDLEQMMVLEYSLRKHASLPLEIHWMQLSTDPGSRWYSSPAARAGWRTERWATPFSGFRWAIPEVCGFQGRAIYMDTDIIALGDIAELYCAPMNEPAVVMARPEKPFFRFCVSLWDCARAQACLPTIEALQGEPDAHAQCTRYFNAHPQLVGRIDPAYNNIDGENLPIDRIRILHYSDMGTQFSHPRALSRLAGEGRSHWFDGEILQHPRRDLAALFERYYEEALASGRNLDDYRNPFPFGTVVKKSERHHKGNRTTRPGLRGLLSWPFGRGRGGG